MHKKIIIFFSSFIFYLSGVHANDTANIADKFIIKDIKVDEISETAELARKNAIIFAQKKAFEILTARIFAEAITGEYTDEEIAALVETIEFRDEIITNQRYEAVINVYFQVEQTEFFINNNLLNKNIATIPVLIIPLFNENGLYKLWQQSNIWYNIWPDVKKSNMVEFKLPYGDLNDMSNFRVSELFALDEAKVAQLKLAYNVEKIIIAEVEYLYNNINEEIKLNAFYHELGKQDQRKLVANIAGYKADNYNQYLIELADKLVTSLEVDWMHYNNSREDANRQNFILKFKDLQDLLKMQEQLTKLKIVKELNIDSFSAKYAKISIDFAEKPLEVFDLIKKLGFKVTREQNYVIIENR